MRMTTVLSIMVLGFVALLLLLTVGMQPENGWIIGKKPLRVFAAEHRPSEQFRELVSRGWPPGAHLEKIEEQEWVVDTARRDLIEQMKNSEIADLLALKDGNLQIREAKRNYDEAKRNYDEAKRNYDEANLVLLDMPEKAEASAATKAEAETIQIRRERVARGEAISMARKAVFDRLMLIAPREVKTDAEIERLESLAVTMGEVGDASWNGIPGFVLLMVVKAIPLLVVNLRSWWMISATF